MTVNEKKNHGGTVTATARELYEGKVAMDAYERAGRNMNLHGHVHEIMYCNKVNAHPANIKNGVHTSLTKSPVATRADVVAMKNGKVVGTAQLKDTTKSMQHTMQQVKNHQYAGTKLMGTKETAAAFEKAVAGSRTPVTQKMTSTGISSHDTKRIAAQMTGQSVSKAALTQAAKSSGAMGAAVSAAFETVNAGADLLDGKIDGGEFAGRVAKEAVGGGLSAATATVAASAATAAVASTLAATTAPVWVPVAAGTAVAIGVGGAVKNAFDEVTSWFW